MKDKKREIPKRFITCIECGGYMVERRTIWVCDTCRAVKIKRRK